MVNGSSPYGVSYTRDALGRISTKTETVQGATDVYGYVYNAAGRLTDVVQNSTAIGHYEYDANGNRIPDADGDQNLTFNQAGTLLSATYDAQDRLLGLEQGPVAVAYTYTANGELQTRTVGTDVTSYGYDVFGNLRSVTFPGAEDVIAYVVDGQNRRVGKKVNGVLARGWLYDGQLRIVAELDGNNAVVSRFVYASKTNVPDYMLSGGVTYRLISDHLGSVRLVANASTGAVAQRLDYDEFGNVLADTNPGFQPFGFAGGLYDPDTGLVRFGVRDYDPVTGRWTAKDPIRFEGRDSNLYGYAFADPVNFRDGDGKDAIGTLGGLAAGLAIAHVLANSSLFADYKEDPYGRVIVLRVPPPSTFESFPLPILYGFELRTYNLRPLGIQIKLLWDPRVIEAVQGPQSVS